jgi:hypothetical protein
MDPLTLGLALATNFAPSLLRYFGAGEKPVAIAEKAIEIARTVTGANDGPTALAALQADPKLAQEYQLAVLAADSDLESMYLADRQDARARDVALHQAGYQNRRADLMVIADVIGLIACLVVLALFKKDIPGEVVALLTTIASLFGLCLRDAHQFEFGSSRGSREKDALLAPFNTPRRPP